MALQVVDLEVNYGKKQVVFGISLEVKDGEVVALVGPNGAGKSTTLHTILGLLHPRKGTILYNGQDVSRRTSAENVKRAVVILRLRRRKEVGSTFLQLIDRYTQELERNGGKLVLAGVGNHVYQQLEATGLLEKLGEEWVYSATDIVTESLRRAIAEAHRWLSEE